MHIKEVKSEADAKRYLEGRRDTGYAEAAYARVCELQALYQQAEAEADGLELRTSYMLQQAAIARWREHLKEWIKDLFTSGIEEQDEEELLDTLTLLFDIHLATLQKTRNAVMGEVEEKASLS